MPDVRLSTVVAGSTAVWCGALVVASWGIFALSLVANSNVELNDVLFLLFLWIAIFLTGCAGVVAVRAWLGTVGQLAVVPVSLLASASVLWLAFLLALGNH